MKRKFVVEVEMPDGCTAKEMKQYIRIAVMSHSDVVSCFLPVAKLKKHTVNVTVKQSVVRTHKTKAPVDMPAPKKRYRRFSDTISVV